MNDTGFPELKYTVVLLGPEKDSRLDEFKKHFSKGIDAIGLDESKHVVVTTALPNVNEFDRGVLVVLWCGAETDNAAADAVSNDETQQIERLLSQGVTVLPVVDSRMDFPKKVPHCLTRLNGLEWSQYHKLIATILEDFGLLRTGKQVFISYKRAESQAVADQLFNRLHHAGYQVFLDTASIEPGRQFQDELKSQLANQDIVVLLHSTNALNSKWVMEEVLDAQRRGTEVFDLRWPGVKPTDNLSRTISQQLSLAISRQLQDEDFKFCRTVDQDRLRKSVLNELVVQIEQARIRSVRTRRDRLLRQMSEDAELAGTNFRYFATGLKNIANIPFAAYDTQKQGLSETIAFVGHGTPESAELHRLCSVVGNRAADIQNARLVYEEQGLLDGELDHLKWLNDLLSDDKCRLLSLGAHYSWLKNL